MPEQDGNLIGGPSSARALAPAELAKLASLSLRARIIVEGAFAGQHHNPKTGAAIEFAEHKEYAPGDEIRRIDWKVVGRQDRYYVKRYEDETEMHTVVLLDASASMGYGRGVSKLTYGGYLAGALGYLLAKQGDPAGLAVCDANLRRYLPPSTRPGQVADLLHTIETQEPAGTTDLARALERVAALTERRSLLIIISDLLDADPAATAEEPASHARGKVVEALAQLRQRGHDVVVFHLLDPDEVALPFRDLTQFLALEPGDTRSVLADAEDLRDAFAAESTAFRARWRAACVESRVEYRFTSTATAPSEILRAFIEERSRARG